LRAGPIRRQHSIIDIVMELRQAEIATLASAFDPAAFYIPPAESLEDEASRPDGGHFNVIHRETALRADVYLAGDDELSTRIDSISTDSQHHGHVPQVAVRAGQFIVLQLSEDHVLDRRHPDLATAHLQPDTPTQCPCHLLQRAERLDLLQLLEQARHFSPD
jgi:hypothetical protein